MSTTKQRLIDASAVLLREQGYTATGVKQIVEAAQAPFGSLYHFFPGGKEELGAAAIRASGELYAQLLPAVFDQAPDVVSGVQAFFAAAAVDLHENGYTDACPIATVALETSSTSEPLRLACAEVFESWIAAGSERLIASGLASDVARELAIGLIASLEGAFVLARATRSVEPLEVAGRQVADAVQRAIEVPGNARS
jgi:AcrR family transcriptional regulator